ncbi:MAG: hypothetical protein P8180_03860 [Gammaproteobacteria bacterium]
MVGLLSVPALGLGANRPATAGEIAPSSNARGAALPTIVRHANANKSSGPHLRFGGSTCMCGHGPNEKQIEAAAKARAKNAASKEDGGLHSKN